MSKTKALLVICDICDEAAQTQEPKGVDLDILGLTLQRGFYAGPGGGGPVPSDLFICQECLPKTTVDVIASIAYMGLDQWKDARDGRR